MVARNVASFVSGFLSIKGNAGRFLFVIDDSDYDLGSWSKVTGLGVTWDSCEYRSGENRAAWIMAGTPKYSKISLSRATGPDSQTVKEWLTETSKNPKTFSGSVKLLGWTGLPIVEWTLKAFCPAGWKIGEFDPKLSNVVIETLELVHAGFLDDDLSFGFGL